MRLLCLGLVIALAIVAVLVSNRDKPIVIGPHVSGQWTFEHADYPICVTVRPPTLRPTPHIEGQRIEPIA